MLSSFLPDACCREAAAVALASAPDVPANAPDVPANAPDVPASAADALGGLAALAGAFDALGTQAVLDVSLPSPTIFAQYFVFAVLLGGIYGLVALGLTISTSRTGR
jgi:branched-chain amino acid transport system permease protein